MTVDVCVRCSRQAIVSHNFHAALLSTGVVQEAALLVSELLIPLVCENATKYYW